MKLSTTYILKWRNWLSKDRIDKWLHERIVLIITSSKFNTLIMITILLNSLSIALETYTFHHQLPILFRTFNVVFLAIYFIEFIAKLYAEPLGYWKNYYNIFDFCVLIIACIQIPLEQIFSSGSSEKSLLQVLTALRALRTLRFISFIKGLQILVEVLLQTFRSTVFYMLFLLFLIMFLAAVFGHILFGLGNPERWGDLSKSMLTLFIYVTADGWFEMTSSTGERLFSIAFIFVGHFIFTNLFIGVIVMNIHSATLHFQETQKQEKDALMQAKKEYMMDKQKEELDNIQDKVRAVQYESFQELAKAFQNTIRPNDFVCMSDHVTTLTWLKTVLTTLDKLENARDNSLRLHFELAENLASLKELQMKEN